MKEGNCKSGLVKGVGLGLTCSVIINTCVIISFYVILPSSYFYIMGLPLAVITYFLLRQKNIKCFFVSWVFSIITHIVLELILRRMGLVNGFYHRAVGDGIRMTAGDGFAILIIYIYNYSWALLGLFASLIKTLITQKAIRNK